MHIHEAEILIKLALSTNQSIYIYLGTKFEH